MSDPDPERRPLRRPFGLILAVAAGALIVARRDELRGSSPAPDPIPLDELVAGQLVAEVPSDTDPDRTSEVIAELLDRLRSTGRGGRLHLPPGDWTIDEPILLDAPGLRLTGAGMRATRLHLAAGREGHLVNVLASGVTVERLSLQGSGPSEGNGHGIRVGANASDLLFRDVLVEDVPSYGIGLQAGSGGGLFDGISMRNVVVRNCGQDGIDFKNIDRDVEVCVGDDPGAMRDVCNGRRTFLRNVSIGAVGMRSGEEGAKAGVDVRGVRSLQNIEAVGLSGSAVGVRFRKQPDGGGNGLGGEGSTLENFVVLHDGPVADGVVASGTEGVEVHNGFVVVGDRVEAFT